MRWFKMFLKDLRNLSVCNHIKFTIPGENSALRWQLRRNTQSLFYSRNGCWYIDKLTLKFTRLLFRLTCLNQYINLSRSPSFSNYSLKDLRHMTAWPSQQQALRSKRWISQAKYSNVGFVWSECRDQSWRVNSAEQVPSSILWGEDGAVGTLWLQILIWGSHIEWN